MSQKHEFRIISLKEVDSTNSWAKSAYAEKLISDASAIVAVTQRAGRGQLRTKWHDEAGKNLLFTLVIHPNKLQASSFFRLNEAVSLGLVDVLCENVSATIKWPNDIFVDNKKIAGILIETIIQGNEIKTAFIGVGLNVNQKIFSEDVRATSLALETNTDFDLSTLLNELLSALEFRLNQMTTPNVLQNNYYDKLLGKNDWLAYRDEQGIFTAKIFKVEEDGRLVLQVENEDEYRYYRFKEVRLIS